MVIGPMKGGTSWLSDFLEFHGAVCLPKDVKETFFFDCNYAKDLGWYEKHFRHYDQKKHQLIMEVAPSYFHCPDAPARVRELLGEIPLVITLRDPVKRSWSHYLHLCRYGYTKKSIQEAAKDYPEILEASMYNAMLKRWQKYFSDDNVKVLWQENLGSNPENYAKEFCRFLDLPFHGLSKESLKPSNESAVPLSGGIAALGRKAAFKLRDMGLYSVVNAAKKLGLKRFFFGKPGSGKHIKISNEDRQWLIRQLKDDYLLLPDKFKSEHCDMSVYLTGENNATQS